jgi:FMN reductase
LLGDRPAAAVGRETVVDVQVVELRDLAVEIAHNFTHGFPGRKPAAAIDAVTSADGLIAVTPGRAGGAPMDAARRRTAGCSSPSST